jgi:predicted nucleotidyltransferase
MDFQSVVSTYLERVKAEGVRVDEAYVFGSFVKGKNWEGSDIDVCILSEDFGTDYDKWSQLLNRVAVKTDARIEPVMFTRREFDNKYDPLAGEIKRFGLKVA